MTSDPRGKIKSEILTGLWSDLKPHAERDAIFVVSLDLDLVDVGTAVMNDDLGSVQKWLAEAQLVRPNPPQLEAWDRTATEKSFTFVIVAPYVLIQELAH